VVLVLNFISLASKKILKPSQIKIMQNQGNRNFSTTK